MSWRTGARGSPDTGPLPHLDPKDQWRMVGIASSTGGPSALVSALKVVPADYPLPILLVQHITRGFSASLAEWLNGELKLRVRLAGGRVILSGQAVTILEGKLNHA